MAARFYDDIPGHFLGEDRSREAGVERRPIIPIPRPPRPLHEQPICTCCGDRVERHEASIASAADDSEIHLIATATGALWQRIVNGRDCRGQILLCSACCDTLTGTDIPIISVDEFESRGWERHEVTNILLYVHFWKFD